MSHEYKGCPRETEETPIALLRDTLMNILNLADSDFNEEEEVHYFLMQKFRQEATKALKATGLGFRL